MSFYLIVVWFHITAAFVWLGGMFFMTLVLAPIARKVNPPSLRAALLSQIGNRFKIIGWICIGILIVTGMLNVSNRWTFEIFSLNIMHSETGEMLFYKIMVVVVMVGLSIVHDFYLGPKMVELLEIADSEGDAGKAAETELKNLKQRSKWLPRVNTILGLVLLYIAVNLAR